MILYLQVDGKYSILHLLASSKNDSDKLVQSTGLVMKKLHVYLGYKSNDLVVLCGTDELPLHPTYKDDKIKDALLP